MGISALVIAGAVLVMWSKNREHAPPPPFVVSTESTDGRFRLPRAIDFPATETPALDSWAPAVDIDSDPRAREFEALLNEGLQAGPNFAGVYTVVSWGCGTACQLSAIIRSETGEIVEFGILSSFGVQYATSTKLFAVNPRDRLDVAGEHAPRVASDYYLFEDDTLRHILKIAEDGTFQRACPSLEVRAEHPITGEVGTFSTPCAVPAGWIAR